MRVLGLCRQAVGAAATLSAALVEPLWELGVELVVDDASALIPDATGGRVDRGVSRALRQAAKGFDLVHAFGYRAAWACAEAFYLRFPWVYSALDHPKTTHPDLIDRLSPCRRGLCSSRAVRETLDRADAPNLEVVVPGVAAPDSLPDREGARASLGWAPGGFVLGVMGRDVPERDLGSVVAAMPGVWARRPDVRLEVAAYGSEDAASPDPRIRLSGRLADRWAFLRAIDLLVVPSPRSGFSLAAAEAMAVGTPVLVREGSGLTEMGVPGASLFAYSSDDGPPPARDKAARAGRGGPASAGPGGVARAFRDLLDHPLSPEGAERPAREGPAGSESGGLEAALCDLLEQPLRLEAAGNAARVQAADRYRLDRFAHEVARVYREILSP